MWRVLQLVPYMRENARIANLWLPDGIVAARASNRRDSRTVRTICAGISVLLDRLRISMRIDCIVAHISVAGGKEYSFRLNLLAVTHIT